jgi:uncharacterized membrane protein YbaN (DUF454 family)
MPRFLYLALAYLCLGLGFIGIFVPGLPTTPFVLVAAWAAARGSARLHRWLHDRPLFGPMVRDWQAHGAVSRRAKWVSTLTMLACSVIFFLTSPRWWMAALGTAIMACVSVWLWLRPEPPASDAAG